jgi:flagellar FliL protein
MAEAAAAATAEGAAGAAPAGGKKAGLIGALTFVGALAGGLLAAVVVAPRIIARQAPAAAHADSSSADGETKPEGEAGTAEGKAGEGDGGEKKMVQLANIIVNPAGSQGTRFLMASVAVSIANEEAQKVLTDHEVEFRDKVTSILESQTMAQLTMPGARDSLKVKIALAAGTIVGPKVPLKVFLPQFVIQ